uniref:Uncharacterized protein LOC104239667 n=1 Tax=Nicotiana sylvestris TaxID=4096 RepID=A0A1U7XKS2_NICSY|nr:PREDICTED: uncharacterized protein LOC104239667 [Nicotiana sylvestris]
MNLKLTVKGWVPCVETFTVSSKFQAMDDRVVFPDNEEIGLDLKLGFSQLSERIDRLCDLVVASASVRLRVLQLQNDFTTSTPTTLKRDFLFPHFFTFILQSSTELARDVLAIPISSVASECVFSTGGHILDSFRSSLTPKWEQALICVQDWFREEKNPISVEEDLEYLEELELAMENNGSTTTII